jgi:hypothetical protein
MNEPEEPDTFALHEINLPYLTQAAHGFRYDRRLDPQEPGNTKI